MGEKRSQPADLWVITSNRGMCGAYNGNVLRAAGEYLQAWKIRVGRTTSDGRQEGRLVHETSAGHEMTEAITDLPDIPRFEDVDPFATAMMDRFLKGEISSVARAYMKFVSAGKQIPVVEQLLPLSPEDPTARRDEGQERELQYEFSPEPRELLDELLPMTVRVQSVPVFQRCGGQRADGAAGGHEGGHRLGRRDDQAADTAVQPSTTDGHHDGAAGHRGRRQRAGLELVSSIANMLRK